MRLSSRLSVFTLLLIFLTACTSEVYDTATDIYDMNPSDMTTQDFDLTQLDKINFDELEKVFLAAEDNNEKARRNFPRFQYTPVQYWLNPDKVVGNARLFRLKNGIIVQLAHSSLPINHAITMWIAIFNNTDYCATSPCSFDDAFNPDVEFDVVYAGGHVVENRRETFQYMIGTGTENSESTVPFFQSGFGLPLPDGKGLLDAAGAEIHLILRSHGPDQEGVDLLSSYEAGCTSFVDFNDPPEFPDADGECGDFDFAVFCRL